MNTRFAVAFAVLLFVILGVAYIAPVAPILKSGMHLKEIESQQVFSAPAQAGSANGIWFREATEVNDDAVKQAVEQL